MGVVTVAPVGDSGGADVACHVGGGGTLRGELFYCFVECFDVHLEALAEDGRHLEFGGEEGCDAGEFGGGWVVAFEEALVNLSVDERVKEDGAGGEAVASCAADLLVVGLDGAGEGDVDDGADVGFVDAHAEGDGGDDDLELAGLEVALDAVASGGVEAGVIGSGSAAEGGGQFFGGPCGMARRRWRGGGWPGT